MSADSHQLHTHSHKDTLSPTCHGLLNVNSHPLSKSSSSLICAGQSSLEERQSNKLELRKSHSSTVCQTLGNESDARSVPSPRWSFSQAGLMVPDGSVVQTMSNLSPDNNSQSRTKTANHFVIVEQSPASWAVGDTKMYVKSSTVENISSACVVHQHSTCQMEEPGAALQRSHSDLTCSCKQQNCIAHIETSATRSSLSSSSSRHGPSVARMSFQSERDVSETNENTSPYQNLGTHLPAIPTDQKVPTNSFDSGGIPRNTTVYTDPGTFHSAVLGPHMPGNGFSNRTMFSQATGIIHGGLTYGNIPNSAYSPMVMPVHNNSAVPCNIRQDSCLKVDATVPAYCHSLPIPSIQLVPRLVCSVSESGKEQAAPGYFHSFSTSDILTYPKLVSSVSESGLDAKRVLKRCSIPGEQLQHAQHCTQQERAPPEAQAACVAFSNQQGTDMVMKTKDMWTMTSVNDLTKGLKAALERRDAEVQTLPTMECKSVATSPAAAAEGHPHVFPEVNLEQQDLEAPKSPVREVRWDDEGMTWEVYGASVDPEVLGLAIQKHLEIQIEQFQTEPLQLAGKRKEDSFNKETSSDKMGKKRPFRTMMHSLRYPSCCTRSSTAVE
ncbi:G protein-regulated inducer of neurite outgrowth 2 [Anser cygnoides]|uniref:G protein-regulated inducer of neurite outgrowth C-terminal domain-containing protein n=1 Tax=Anser cygnoides TaxID=8845 RepID=A0A8B9EFC8_ANSCY|nr:G protein-regulated inducer of neurite outgrowth 2 isoform X2 [Anser cygnoides]XP_013030276.2 G protein-regulated inducer of neurite outgrowth 2 isoform X2 [Anser cygnoides]XP_013030277.2 G protein-regulated inducer of neurite outgrowth 2 isoform X2 [Anser cygnoides]XP_013030297.2 G protein-regulated inducer of neurite outgrowth 2 isoform X2 [Anser cygnoides]XP_047930852.1 G protein-regulated inducer of neurite outgrowth 2 isoform X2 [Anser cygnoides]